MSAKTNYFLEALGTLGDDQVIDVTNLDTTLNVLCIKPSYSVLKSKYLLVSHPVVSNTYFAIAEASSILSKSTGRKEGPIGEILNTNQVIRLRRVSPDTDPPAGGAFSGSSSALSCYVMSDRSMTQPVWLSKMYKLGNMNKPCSVVLDGHSEPKSITRYKDIPSIESMFKL